MFFRGENQKGGNFNRGTVKLGQNKDMTGGGFKSMFYIHLQILDRWGVMESNFDLRIFFKMCWEWEKTTQLRKTPPMLDRNWDKTRVVDLQIPRSNCDEFFGWQNETQRSCPLRKGLCE